MFVRKRGNSYQLIESYRDESGKSQKREVVNLSPHATPEVALEAWREELEDLTAEFDAAIAPVVDLERYIQETWMRGLEKWYGWRIPSLAEVLERAQEDMKEYHPGEPHSPDFMPDYSASFVEVTEDRTVDLSDFIWALRKLEAAREEAQVYWAEVEEDARRLKEKIAILEGVVVSK
jgi:hypothetical protein